LPPAPEPTLADRLLNAALEETMKRTPASSAPQSPLLSKGEQLAAGILAALNPEAYANLVTPELARRTRAREVEAATAAREEGKEADRLFRGAQIAGTMEERDAARGAKETALTREQKGYASRLDAASDAFAAMLAPVPMEDGTEAENGFSAGVRVLQESGDPYDAAIAASMVTRVQRVNAILQKASAPGFVLSDDLVTDVEKQLEGINDDLSAQLDKSRSAAASRASAETRDANAAERLDIAGERLRIANTEATRRGSIDQAARNHIAQYGSSLAQLAILTDLMDSVEWGRLDKYTRGMGDENFKRLLGYWQHIRAPYVKNLIGVAQTGGEAERLSTLLEDPGNVIWGDPETIRVAKEGMEFVIVNDYVSTLMTQADAGRTVKQEWRRFSRDVVPRISPAVLQQVIRPPLDDPNIPEGSILVSYMPDRRVYMRPDGVKVEWAEDELVGEEP
jgi:hypothetical protein